MPTPAKFLPRYMDLLPRIAACYKVQSEGERIYMLNCIYHQLGDPFTPKLLDEIYAGMGVKVGEKPACREVVAV